MSVRAGYEPFRPGRLSGVLLVVAVAAMLSACGTDLGSRLPSASSTSAPSEAAPTTGVTRPPVSTQPPITAIPTTTVPDNVRPPADPPTTGVPPTSTSDQTTIPPVSEPTTSIPQTTVPASTTPPNVIVPTSAPTTPTTLPGAEEGSSTTTKPPAGTEAASDQTPWGWIVLALALLIGLIVGVILLMLASGKRRRDSTWRAVARPAYEQAVLARDLLMGDGVNTDDGARRQSVQRQVEEAAAALSQAAESAPDDLARRTANSSAAALRGLVYAMEADRLLRTGGRAPTADELARADESRRRSLSQLDLALAALEQRTATPEGN